MCHKYIGTNVYLYIFFAKSASLLSEGGALLSL